MAQSHLPWSMAFLVASAIIAAVAGASKQPDFQPEEVSPDFIDRYPQFGPVPDFNDIGQNDPWVDPGDDDSSGTGGPDSSWEDDDDEDGDGDDGGGEWGSVSDGETAPEVSSFNSHVLGDVTGLTTKGHEAIITCGRDKVRVQFYRHDIVRLWVGWDGKFTDPASDDIVVHKPTAGIKVKLADMGDYFEIWTGGFGGVSVRAQKSPMRISMRIGDSQIWEEAVGLSKNATATFQTLAADGDEFFFGGGMQNGRFSHRGHRIRITRDKEWGEGGNPNAVPFYLSSAGYGVYRNTWAPGYYDFSEVPVVLAHNESRFDAFYFLSTPKNFKSVLEGYTWLTGRPFMPPIYGLGLGNSDCYHNERHIYDTHVVLSVAAKYRQLDMPGAWFLPNDGKRCGFGVGPKENPLDFDVLDDVANQLEKKYGFKIGLQYSKGEPNITRGVAEAGVRVIKTDVAWVGNGYQEAFNAVQQSVQGIENNSKARRFVWTVEGWAGTQRLAAMWTGDNVGSFDYVRWQIPTFIGTGFSAIAHVSGDLDGIFRGTPETYVRDLQFKSMMTVMMATSGWAKNPDKHPWTWGEPYTAIARQYLRLKMQMTPYLYSLSRHAYDTGVPPIRAMALEFPDDLSTFSEHTGSAHQFMVGPWLLVAPIFRPVALKKVRDGIYLPAGTWVDFWDGSLREGPKGLDGYPCPLNVLPIFVLSGAIVPMWPEMLYPGERPVDPLILDIYPSGESNFDLYEDDGVTREALEKDKFSITKISCKAHKNAINEGGHILLSVGAGVGSYRGKLPARGYIVHVFTAVPPIAVQLKSEDKVTTLSEVLSFGALDYATSGWFFSKIEKGGTVHIKTPRLDTDTGFELELKPDPTIVHSKAVVQPPKAVSWDEPAATTEDEEEEMMIYSNQPKYDHVHVKACKHPPLPEQTFDFIHVQGISRDTGIIRSRSQPDSCLTASTNIDRTYWTPTLDFQPCLSGKSKTHQLWQLDGITHHVKLRNNPSKHCLDAIGSAHKVIVSSCYSEANMNQQFKYDNNTGTFTTANDGSCMTVGVHTTKRRSGWLR